MAEIRRHVFAAEAAPPDKEAAAKNRTALSLAAAACRDKGVILNPEGLASYAAKIDPEGDFGLWPQRQIPDGEGQQSSGGRGRQKKRQDDSEHEKEGGEKAGAITAAELKKMALKTEAFDPLLALLNRLPGKNGRRWVVIPFSFGKDGREYRVSMRILLEREAHVSRMVMNITENSGTLPQKHWVFSLKPAGDRPSLAVFVQPALPPGDYLRLEQEFSQLMDTPRGKVSVKNYTEPFYCESSFADNLLNSVNEAV